jgi:hypothetical protein
VRKPGGARSIAKRSSGSSACQCGPAARRRSPPSSGDGFTLRELRVGVSCETAPKVA